MSRRTWAFDAAIAAVVAVLGVLEAFWGVDATHRQGPHWAEALLYVVTALLLVVRRVNPVGCLTLVVVVSIAEFAVFGSPEGMGVALPGIVAVYTVARREDRRRAWWGLVLAVVLWAAWTALDPMNRTLSDGALTVVWLFPWLIAWLLGALVRATRQAAEQRRLVRQQRASQAVAEERNRIARELHDVIGHSVSVMTVQASAVRRRLARGPGRGAAGAGDRGGSRARGAGRDAPDGRGAARGRRRGRPRARRPGWTSSTGWSSKFRAAGLPVERGSHRPAAAAGAGPGPDGLPAGPGGADQHAAARARRRAACRGVDRLPRRAPRARGPRRRTAGGCRTPRPGTACSGMRERVSVYGGDAGRPAAAGGRVRAARRPCPWRPA